MTTKINFTKEILLASRPRNKGERIVLWDKKVAGLLCRISYSGSITFSVHRRTKSGQQERITIGRFPQTTIDQARIAATKINASIASGENPAEVKRSFRAEPTLDELFQIYLDTYSKLYKRSWKDDECRYRIYLKGSLGRKKITQVGKDDVQRLHTQIAQSRKTFKSGKTRVSLTVTANRVLSLISSIYSWALRTGYSKINPAVGIQKFPEKSRDRFLQPEELERFFSAVNEENNATIRDYVLLSLYTGARRSNIQSMQWKDISLHHKLWMIPITKNNDPVVIPLIDEALEILKSRHGNNSDFVFPSDSKTGHLLDPKNGWARILDRAGIENLRLHDLRRTLGSWQAIMGSSALIIGKSLGHRSQKATEVYARLNIEPVRKSIEVAARAMIKSASNK